VQRATAQSKTGIFLDYGGGLDEAGLFRDLWLSGELSKDSAAKV
jgi:hypothetical protein